MTGKQKKQLRRILVGAVLFSAALTASRFFSFGNEWLACGYFAVPYLLLGFDVICQTAKKIAAGNLLDEDFLMTVASVGAFACKDGAEGTAVILFYQVGTLFESIAVGKSRKSVTELMDIRPDTANRLTEQGSETVPAEEISADELILLKPGERIPLDGVVVEGKSSIDTAALTGESVPREVGVGDTVLSGCVNQSGTLTVRVTGTAEQSTAARILELVENATANKSKSERFITKFARIYTPSVVGAAILLALIPSVITGNWGEWIHRALTFLVVSCPCALVISVPLSFFGGIGAASRSGILFKGSAYMETLAKAKLFLFDKTGTLTKGRFEITSIFPAEKADEILYYAAAAERDSSHPIALPIRNACPQAIHAEIGEIEEIAGHGVRATVDGKTVLVGNTLWVTKNGMTPNDGNESTQSILHVAVDGGYLGCVGVADSPKESAFSAISALKAAGNRTVMLSGDRVETARRIGEQLGLDEVYGELLPQQKSEQMRRLMEESGLITAYVGDGINDAPVLAGSDVGIAMGGIGSDAAIEAADVVLMHDNPMGIVTAVNVARKTLSIAKQNIIFACAVKLTVLVLSALGITGMWLAVFGDVGVSVLAIMNAMRALKIGQVKINK